MLYKKCNKCNELKSVDNFFKRKGSKDGYRNDCKECSKESDQKRSAKRKEQRQSREIITEGRKICRICNIEKDLSEFHIKRGTPDGHRSECKECVKNTQKEYKDPEKQREYDKQRYQERKEEILERKKKYHKDNKDRILEEKKNYREENKDNINDYMKKYREEHREEAKEYARNNPNKALYQETYRLRHPHIVAWRTTLYATLKRMGTKKENSTAFLLGYSAEDLRKDMESKFLSGMTWDNHGEWHIDHIYPVTKFPTTTPVSEVCALSNLQPLWGSDNLSKSNNL